ALLRRDLHATDARVDARGLRPGLRPHRPRQGPRRRRGDRATRAPQRAPAPRHHGGRAGRIAARRVGAGGERLHVAGARAAGLRDGAATRLQRAPRHPLHELAPRDRRQPRRRTSLHGARSPHRGAMSCFARRFARRWTSPLGLLLFAVVTAMAVSAPYVFPEDPFAMVTRPLQWPGESRSYVLGSDMLGRDLLAGIFHGARVSLL